MGGGGETHQRQNGYGDSRAEVDGTRLWPRILWRPERKEEVAVRAPVTGIRHNDDDMCGENGKCEQRRPAQVSETVATAEERGAAALLTDGEASRFGQGFRRRWSAARTGAAQTGAVETHFYGCVRDGQIALPCSANREPAVDDIDTDKRAPRANGNWIQQ
jgi:hypothetical protein